MERIIRASITLQNRNCAKHYRMIHIMEQCLAHPDANVTFSYGRVSKFRLSDFHLIVHNQRRGETSFQLNNFWFSISVWSLFGWKLSFISWDRWQMIFISIFRHIGEQEQTSLQKDIVWYQVRWSYRNQKFLIIQLVRDWSSLRFESANRLFNFCIPYFFVKSWYV